jgi:predicted ATPase
MSGQQTMIKKIILENFKSFGKRAEIDVKDLQVITGANSSGKSSILQALLLIKQSFLRNERGGELDLNGNYVKASSYLDLVFNKPNNPKANFSVGFELELPIFSLEFLYLTNQYFREERNRYPLSDITLDANAKVKFDFALMEQDRYGISNFNIEVHHPELGEIYFDGSKKRGFFDLSIEMIRSKKLKNFSVQESVKRQSNLSDLNSFLPEGETFVDLGSWEAIRFNKILGSDHGINLYSIEPYINDFQTITTRLSGIRNGHPFSEPDFWSAITELLKAQFALNTSFEIITDVQFSKFKPEVDPPSFFKDGFDDPADAEAYWKADSYYGQTEGLSSLFLSPVSKELFKFFDNLEYLGPLRARPERAYLSIGSAIDIGQSGENSIPFLWQNQQKQIETKYSIYGKLAKDELLTATQKWLKKFGLSEQITISKPGGMAFLAEVELYKGSKKKVTIADIGFGISQILPVIVLVLNSKAGQTIILEQPEIHLHPKMQGILADFLLCHAVVGKKFIVETHSEHLINTLRLRIVEDSNLGLKNKVGVNFVRKGKMTAPKKRGSTKKTYIPTSLVDHLEIDEMGKIINWPRDFFPDSMDISRKLLKAMAKKSKRLE